jgi:hypothetical protein
VVAQFGRRGGSVIGGVVAQYWEAWWLSVGRRGDSVVVRLTIVLQSPASPQPTADRQSSGWLPPGMALGCGLTSVRGDRGENYEKRTAGSPKKI